MNRLVYILILFSTVFGYAQQPTRSFGDQGNGTFLNPIFAGEYPDPTILRDGRDYYITHTSLNNYPGLLIWHSTDLVNWKPIAHALTKNVGEIWAPDLVKYKNRYYIYFPAWDYRTTMVVVSDKITGPWSDPVELKVSFIDPGHVVGEDGKRYLYFSDGNVVQLSEDGLSTIGSVRSVYEGWKYPSGWLTECFCLESPKLFRKGEYFYLISAQGGTSGPPTSHMAVAARSKSVLGPWENSPYNPIVHTYSYNEKWWSKGHATFVETPEGEWWMVYHSFLNNFRTLGRMDILEPVEWTSDGWPRVKTGSDPARPIVLPSNSVGRVKPLPESTNGFSVYDWHAYREYIPERYTMDKEMLIIRSAGDSLAKSDPIQFTPAHPSYRTEVKVDTKDLAKAGYVLFYGPKFYRGLEVSSDSISYITEKRRTRIAGYHEGTPVNVRIVNNYQTLALYYSLDGLEWENVWDAADVSPYTGNLLGNFRSLKLALYSYGKGSTQFSEFHYEPVN